MIQGFINGIKNMLGSVGKAIASVGEKIKNFLHFSRPDEGPLREYETWMPDMIQGLTKTLEKAAPTLYDATKGIAKNISKNLDISGEADLQANVYKNTISKITSLEPNAYSVQGSSLYNASKDDSITNAKLSRLDKLIALLEYYLPLVIKASGHEIAIDGKTLVAELIPIIDEELAT